MNDMPVEMTCMTTKMKFETSFDEGLQVVVLKNGRYAYRAKCPWQGKSGKDLHAFKFCGKNQLEMYNAFLEREES